MSRQWLRSYNGKVLEDRFADQPTLVEVRSNVESRKLDCDDGVTK